MKYIFLIVLIGCASSIMKLKIDKSRGYSEKEISLILKNAEVYSSEIEGHAAIGNKNEKTKVISNLSKIFCKCIKLMGDKCFKPSRNLPAKQKKIWVKANAAEVALKTDLPLV